MPPSLAPVCTRTTRETSALHLASRHGGAHGRGQILGVEAGSGAPGRYPLRGSEGGQVCRRLGAVAADDGGTHPDALDHDRGQGMIRKAANTEAAPESSLTGFDRGHRAAFDDQPGQQRRPSDNASDDKPAIRPQLHDRTRGRHDRCCAGRHRVASRGKLAKPRAASMHRICIDNAVIPAAHNTRTTTSVVMANAASTAETGFTGSPDNAYTRDVSARPMMLVNAPTIESPVTTL